MSEVRDLSVIVPVYNAAGFIEAAVRSVLDQVPEGRSVEIVIADDGSTDATAEVIAGLGEPERVRYHRQENQGPSAARNLALQHASGSLLMLLDADDSLRDGCLATTLDFLERHSEVGLFFTNYDIFDETGIVTGSGVDIWKRFRRLAHVEPAAGEWIFEELLTPHILEAGGFMHTSGLTFRREVYEQVGGFREGFSYGEDDDFYARLAHATRVGYVDRVLSRKRNHPGSIIHDPANALRNLEHLLRLAELQHEDYRDDPALAALLDRKVSDLARDWCWHLINAGHAGQARKELRGYLSRHPRDLRFYRLWLRSWFGS